MSTRPTEEIMITGLNPWNNIKKPILESEFSLLKGKNLVWKDGFKDLLHQFLELFFVNKNC